VINSISNRPGHPGYVPPRPPATPAAKGPSFEEAVAAKPAAAPVEADAVQAGLHLSRAYELASMRRPGSSAVPQDLLWALTGPGGT